MNRRQASTEVPLQALLESGKALPRQQEAVRARVLARARTTAAAPQALLPPAPAPPRPRFPPHAMVPAAAAALAVGIAGTVYALSGYWSRPAAADGVISPPGPSSAAPRATAARVKSLAVEAPEPSLTSAPRIAQPSAVLQAKSAPSRTRPAGAGQASYDAELELMRSAHTAYAAHDYANALVLAGEHVRRFPNGALAEEREALRVRCLVGAGRTSEARRAAAAFATRFPRSVLLQRLQAEAGG